MGAALEGLVDFGLELVGFQRRRAPRSPLRDRLDFAAGYLRGRLAEVVLERAGDPTFPVEAAHELLDDVGVPRRVPAAASITLYTSPPTPGGPA